MELSKATIKKLSMTLRTTAITSLARALVLKYPKAEVYLVGGFLRDLMLGRDSKDIDLVVRGVPAKKLEQFLQNIGKVNLVGRTFGVFKFIPKHKSVTIDIALPRTDFAAGTGGYRDVDVQSDWKLPIEKDLSRRDFTVNAMAWNILTHELIDPWNGADDLKTRTIRAVGAPETRFREDYSRMLRALRLTCQLNFIIETKTWRAITKNIKKINSLRASERIVPYETIAKELLKSFQFDPVRSLDLWDAAGAIPALIPELHKMKKCAQPKNFHSEGDVWAHTRLALSVLSGKKFRREFPGEPNAELIMAVLFHDAAKPLTMTLPKKRGERIRFDGHDAIGATLAKKIAERLRLASYKDERIDVDSERLAWLVRHHLLLISGDIASMRATTIEKYYLRDERLGKELLALQYADGSATLDPNGRPTLREYKRMKTRIAKMIGKRKPKLPPPLLDGNEIMTALKIKPGPEVGSVILKLREAQLRGKVTTKKQALKFLRGVGGRA